MASQKGEITRYLFNRDFRSSIRLNYMHWMVKELCGYLLHPKIQYDKSNVRIADIGTGTGIWPLELANELPSSARIDGFDISSDQFPPQAWRGKNVNLLTHDAFKPFPPEYHGQYDIVNLRFLLTVVNNEDAEPLLNNLITLLKSGGHLTWFELHPYASQVIAPNPSTSKVAVERLVETIKKPTPTSSYDWVAQLPSSFSKNGLHLETCDKIPMKDCYRLILGQGYLAGLEDINAHLVGEEKAEEARKLIDGLSAEFAQGVSIDTPYLCVVGRKMA